MTKSGWQSEMKRVASVPARINIIGEHTDHFGGLSLAFSSQHRLVMTATSRDEGIRGEETIVRLWKAAGGWNANLSVESNIPIGAGLSSSAALCVAIAMCSLGPRNKMEIATQAQRIEHEILKTKCGLLDQIAITHSQSGSASMIDFKKMEVKNFPIPDDWIFKLVDTGIRRSLRKTEYNVPNSTEETRKKHCQNESLRVSEALSCDATQLGKLLNLSHSSISEKIRTSTPEVDLIVKKVQHMPGVLGARLMGGGFGGMILALLKDERALPGEALSSSDSAFLQESL